MASGTHLLVKFLQRLCRVAELTQEDSQQVFGLEGSDGRLDTFAGNVANHSSNSGRRNLEDVEEITGHKPRTGLVDPANLKVG